MQEGYQQRHRAMSPTDSKFRGLQLGNLTQSPTKSWTDHYGSSSSHYLPQRTKYPQVVHLTACETSSNQLNLFKFSVCSIN